LTMSDGLPSIFSQPLYKVLLAITSLTLLYLGIVYTIYFLSRRDKYLIVTALVSIILSVAFHIFTY
jgi:hypothetical protein